jgi:hypothetical protein
VRPGICDTFPDTQRIVMVIVAYQQGVQKMKVNRNRLATAGIEGKPLISEGDEQYLGRIIPTSCATRS